MWERCETCNGTGWEEWHPDYMNIIEDIGYRKCWDCDGTGSIHIDDEEDD